MAERPAQSDAEDAARQWRGQRSPRAPLSQAQALAQIASARETLAAAPSPYPRATGGRLDPQPAMTEQTQPTTDPDPTDHAEQAREQLAAAGLGPAALASLSDSQAMAHAEALRAHYRQDLARALARTGPASPESDTEPF